MKPSVLFTLLLLLLLPLLPPGAQAQSAPSSFVPGAQPPTPPIFDAARATTSSVRLDQGAQLCPLILRDSGVDQTQDTTPWLQFPLRSTRIITTSLYYSPAKSIFFEENSLGLTSTGQDVTINAGTTAIHGSLWYRYKSGSTQAGDQLQVEIYQVGKVNTSLPVASINAFDAGGPGAQADDQWHQFSWSITNTMTLASLRSLSNVTFLVTTRSAGGPAQQLWVDDIQMDTCLPSIEGTLRATSGGAPVANAQVLLTHTTSTGNTISASGTTDVNGIYSFSGVSPLGTGETYQIWFLNAPLAAVRPDTLLGFWAGPTINPSTLLAQPILTLPDLIVGDVALNSPASYSTQVATDASPLTLSWAGRGVIGETYQFCIYDPQRVDPTKGMPIQVCGPQGTGLSFQLSPQSFASVPNFGFSYGRSYRWYVVAYAGSSQYGHSFYERAISLTTKAISPPSQPVTPSPNLPAAASNTADWTLMVYMAGDNPLGESQNTQTPAPLDSQLTDLRALAAGYPNLHLVTLSDSYGDTGVQFCYLPPTRGADCQERGEINTGDPATMAEFVQTALARYPANHTLLIIAGPGHPIGGLGYDLTTAGTPAIDTAGLRAAFAAAGLGAGKRLDLIFYQGSLMGTIEVAAANAPYARYMVASADDYWSLSLYNSLLPLLTGAQKDQPAEVAKSLVGIYSTVVSTKRPGTAHSMAAYDLDRATAANDALNGLGTALQAELNMNSGTAWATLPHIRQAVSVYDASGNGLLNQLEQAVGQPLAVQEDGLVDIKKLASAIQAAPALPTAQPAAGNLVNVLTGASNPLVLASSQVSGQGVVGYPVELSGTSGVSAFFPTGLRLGQQPTMVQRYLYGSDRNLYDSAWAGFLRLYLAHEIGRGPGGATAGPLGGAQLRAPSGGVIRGSGDLFLPLVVR
jgi:hypothetical protein